MRTLPEIRSCANRDDLIQHCNEVKTEVLEFIREIPDDYLEAKAFPEGWSAARNIRHVASSVRLFSRWIGAPAWLLKILGRAKQPVQPIEERIATNRPANFDYGTYPKPAAPASGLREKVTAEFADSIETLKRRIMKRSEEELLTLRGPIGGMNLMVFALFALKHVTFHLGVVRGRLEAR